MLKLRASEPRPVGPAALVGRIPTDELAELERLSTPVYISAGDRLIKAGSIGREVFLVATGGLRVVQNGQTIATIPPGEFAGELSLLTSRERNADVEAEFDSVIYVFSIREFHSLLDQCPSIARHVLTDAVGRLQTAS